MTATRPRWTSWLIATAKVAVLALMAYFIYRAFIEGNQALDAHSWQAEPLWLSYIPKSPKMGHFSRSTAIWGLGKRYQGQPQPQLADLLIERLTDPNPLTEPPEVEYVRYNSAVTLAAIQGHAHVPRMIRWVGEDVLKSGERFSEHGLAIRWAVEQLTGEKFPDLQPVPRSQSGWFLEPTHFD